MNKHKQQGATMIGMTLIAGAVIAGAILVAKLVPAYMEFMSVKKVLNSMATSGDLRTMSPKELKDGFFKRADIDNITNVKSEDVSISREGNDSVVNVEYSVKVPVAANLSACMDFVASTSAKAE